MNQAACETAFDFAFGGLSVDEIAKDDYQGDTKRVEEDIRYALKNPHEFRKYVIQHG